MYCSYDKDSSYDRQLSNYTIGEYSDKLSYSGNTLNLLPELYNLRDERDKPWTPTS